MKNILITIGILSSILIAGPIHDKLDPRLMGKSFGGNLDDNIANKDGLGALNLQHHSGKASINNELKIQGILKKLEQSIPDTVDKTNLKGSLLSGLIGTNEQKTEIENIESNSNDSGNSNTAENCFGAPIGSTTPSGLIVVDNTTIWDYAYTDTSICTSNVTNMFGLYDAYNHYYSGEYFSNIEYWDTSNVTDMGQMFHYSTSFNRNISAWDVSKVTNMNHIFWKARIFNNGDAAGVSNTPLIWNTSSLVSINYGFGGAVNFNQSLNNWDVSNLIGVFYLFYGIHFNQPLNNWKLDSLQSYNGMFYNAISFNQDISGWDVSHISTIPNNFDDLSGFDGQTALHPQWGAKPPVAPVEESNMEVGDIKYFMMDNENQFLNGYSGTVINGPVHGYNTGEIIPGAGQGGYWYNSDDYFRIILDTPKEVLITQCAQWPSYNAGIKVTNENTNQIQTFQGFAVGSYTSMGTLPAGTYKFEYNGGYQLIDGIIFR